MPENTELSELQRLIFETIKWITMKQEIKMKKTVKIILKIFKNARRALENEWFPPAYFILDLTSATRYFFNFTVYVF